MKLQSAKISKIRTKLGIPAKGFDTIEAALAWYRKHYQEAIGKTFTGNFGFRFDEAGRQLGFDYDYDYATGRLTVSPIPAINKKVPFDRECWSLAQAHRIDWFWAAVFRPILLMWKPGANPLYIPKYLAATLGEWKLLFYAPGGLSNRAKTRFDKETGQSIVTTMLPERRISLGRTQKYWDTLMAYGDVVYESRIAGKPLKNWGHLKRIAAILKDKYGWEETPDSYTVNRYLSRAKKIWNMEHYNW
ncbi:MAG: hypothetical protein HY673_17315 [Chloroflexi bacterium]|nr:hypothetical protein [Chloroflexota bacterium]